MRSVLYPYRQVLSLLFVVLWDISLMGQGVAKVVKVEPKSGLHDEPAAVTTTSWGFTQDWRVIRKDSSIYKGENYMRVAPDTSIALKVTIGNYGLWLNLDGHIITEKTAGNPDKSVPVPGNAKYRVEFSEKDNYLRIIQGSAFVNLGNPWWEKLWGKAKCILKIGVSDSYGRATTLAEVGCNSITRLLCSVDSTGSGWIYLEKGSYGSLILNRDAQDPPVFADTLAEKAIATLEGGKVIAISEKVLFSSAAMQFLKHQKKMGIPFHQTPLGTGLIGATTAFTGAYVVSPPFRQYVNCRLGFDCPEPAQPLEEPPNPPLR